MAFGLGFDLGLNWNPFKMGVKSAASFMSSSFSSSSKSSVGSIGGIFNALTSVKGLVGSVFAIGAVAGFSSLLKEGIDAAQELNDTLFLTAQATAAAGGAFDKKAIEEWSKSITIASAMAQNDILKAYNVLLTAGITQNEAQRLTRLTIDIAKATGKSTEEAARMVGKVATGSLMSLGKLIPGIVETGDKTKDAMIGLDALQAKFGGASAQIADPIEHLKTTMHDIGILIAENIIPQLDPLIQKASDFLLGWANTTAAEDIAKIGQAIKDVFLFTSVLSDAFVASWHVIKAFFNSAADGINIVVMSIFNDVTNTIPALIQKAVVIMLQVLKSELSRLPFGEDIIESMGIDKAISGLNEKIAQSVADSKNNLDPLKDAYKKSGEELFAATQQVTDVMSGKTLENSIVAKIDKLAETGKGIREAAQQAQIDAGKDDLNIVGNKAIDEERQKALKELRKKKNKFGEASDGMQIKIGIVSTRPDRFRRVKGVNI